MIIRPTRLAGVAIIETEPVYDVRGAFARTFDRDVFAGHGLDAQVMQCSTSFNPQAGTLRGLHYQADPYGEGKLIRCTRGRIFDVAVDLRPESVTHREWFGIELSADGMQSLFVSKGCAHGFQTLELDSEIHYQMTTAYVPDAYRGVRWNDPAFDIRWPRPVDGKRIISDRDRAFGDYTI